LIERPSIATTHRRQPGGALQDDRRPNRHRDHRPVAARFWHDRSRLEHLPASLRIRVMRRMNVRSTIAGRPEQAAEVAHRRRRFYCRCGRSDASRALPGKTTGMLIALEVRLSRRKWRQSAIPVPPAAGVPTPLETLERGIPCESMEIAERTVV
jgi:hypothetical protein